MSSVPRIAIVGGGPAGLTAAVLLHKQGIPSTVFELRPQPTAEELALPSGVLDLHPESGLAALKACDLYEGFLQLTGECTEDNVICNAQAEVLHSDKGEASERPEITRNSLSSLLMSGLPAEYIRWNHKLVSATTSSTSTTHAETVLDFGPDGKHTFDLVIGADGTWSKVRNLLTDVKPHYAGTQNLTVTIRNISTRYPHLADLIGSGSFNALGNRHGIISHRSAQDSARLYVMYSSDDEHWAQNVGLVGKTPVQVKEQVLSDPTLMGSWAPILKELVTVACDDTMADYPDKMADIKPLYMLPVGHSWDHKPGVTVIGDAAHLMTPWAGEGVNLALWDSLLLAQAIIKARDQVKDSSSAGGDFAGVLDPMMKDFEVDMAARAVEKAQESYDNGKMLFGDNGAQDFANFFLQFGPPPE